MSKEKPGGWLWKRKPEKPFGSVDQKYSKHIKEPVMWWLTLAHWRSEGERTLGAWIRTAHPTEEGAKKKRRKEKKKLEISRGDYCQGQQRCQEREEIKRRSFQKKMWAGLMLATFPLFFILAFFLAFFCWLHLQSVSGTISEIFCSLLFMGWNRI